MRKRIFGFLVLICIFWTPKMVQAETLASTIVSEAESYVGRLPYVYGGNSLATGADCSGFICAVYQKYGYNLWGSRTSLRNLPSSIATNIGTNINSALPGDIITLNSSSGNKHVGIYAGNGYLINAANAKEGVVKKKYSVYGSVYAITRVNGVVQTVSDTIQPIISNVEVYDVSAEGYTVGCYVTDAGGSGIDRVQFPSWTTASGQDDLDPNWWSGGYSRGTQSGSYFSFRVNTNQHNHEGGEYITHIYAFDKAGNYSSVGTSVWIDRTPPAISDVKILNIDATGYTVQCTATDESGIWKVHFPTWTDKNSQDDLAENWNENSACAGTVSGSVYTFRVNDSEHNWERGIYHTHIYAWDNYGNSVCYKLNNIDFQNTYQAVNTASYNGNTYRLYNDCVTWEEAKKKCEELGGHLVTITSAKEQEVVAQLVSSQVRRGYWMGGRKIGGSTWVTGEGFSYTNWDPGEPNGENGEDCYGIYSATGTWNDWSNTDYFLGFICEWEKPAASNNQQTSANPGTGNVHPLTQTYTVTYHVNGGNELRSVDKMVVNGEKYGFLPSPTRENYIFKGWYTQKSGGIRITAESVVNLGRNTTLYAHWSKVTVKASTIRNLKNVKGKKAVVKFKKVNGAEGYEILYSTDRKFKKNKKTITAFATSKTLTKMSKGKNYYVKVRTFKSDSMGKKVYGNYSSVRRIKIKQ